MSRTRITTILSQALAVRQDEVGIRHTLVNVELVATLRSDWGAPLLGDSVACTGPRAGGNRVAVEDAAELGSRG